MIRNLKIIATNNMKKNFLNIADLNEKQIEEILLLSKRIEENDLNINLNKKKLVLFLKNLQQELVYPLLLAFMN